MERTKPFFSIVMPLYNKRNHVKKTIESAFAQTFQGFEVVVINDGSTDDSAAVVETIEDTRIRLIHQENAGVSAARNRGIKEANADYIVFLDADDLWSPEFLQIIKNLIDDYPGAGIYATAYKLLNSKGVYESISNKGLLSASFTGLLPSYFKLKSNNVNLVWTSAACVPKNVFFENNIWFPEGVKYYEDVYVWARIALIKDVAYSASDCALYSLEAENSTRDAMSVIVKPSDVLISLRSYVVDSKDLELKKWLNRYVDRHIYNCITRSINAGNKRNAIKTLTNHHVYSGFFIYSLVKILTPVFVMNFLRLIKRRIRRRSN